MNFENTPEFDNDVKRLKKKWRSLPNDIVDAQLTISNVYTGDELFAQKFFNGKRATKLKVTEKYEVVKMRLDVAALSSNSKVRLIFVVIISDNLIKFIELYAKNSNEREDEKRIQKYT